MSHHHYGNRSTQPRSGGLARGLGWFSIGLGVAELLAPRAVARTAGLKPGNSALVRLYGLREIAVGLGILRSANAAPWLWGRVGGDMLDIATVGKLADKTHVRSSLRASAALTNLAMVAAVDAYAAQSYKREPNRQAGRDYPDYSKRSGFPRPAHEMRGAALGPKRGIGSASQRSQQEPKHPGDEAPPGAPQTGELPCPHCRGSGLVAGRACDACEGTGRVTVIVGDA